MKTDKQIFLEASTVAGCSSDVEESLIRLMIWVGTSLRSTAKHSKLTDPLKIWRDGTAWCDQHVRVLSYFAWHLLSVEGRQLELTHTHGHGHTVCELRYHDMWHLFDVHTEHLSIYRDVNNGNILSNDELRCQPDIVKAQYHGWPAETNSIDKSGFYAPGSSFRVWPLDWT